MKGVITWECTRCCRQVGSLQPLPDVLACLASVDGIEGVCGGAMVRVEPQPVNADFFEEHAEQIADLAKRKLTCLECEHRYDDPPTQMNEDGSCFNCGSPHVVMASIQVRPPAEPDGLGGLHRHLEEPDLSAYLPDDADGVGYAPESGATQQVPCPVWERTRQSKLQRAVVRSKEYAVNKSLVERLEAELPASEHLIAVSLYVQKALKALEKLRGLPDYAPVADILDLQHVKLTETQMWSGQLFLRLLPGIKTDALDALLKAWS